MSFYSRKKILVTGGTGLIGRPLVKMLADAGASVAVVSMDRVPYVPEGCVNFWKADLREMSVCKEVCEGQDIVFQLAGIKGSPIATKTNPASFFVPTLQFSTNMMRAAFEANVEWYLNTSSIGVYGPAEVFYEDAVWDDKPSTHDRFAGWAKRIGEMQAEAYKIEFGWDRCSIVRPANVYGAWDSFSDESAMVVPSLIKRALNLEEEFICWGDGSPIRDFIHANDVARGMMMVVENQVREPVNLGSGVGVTIKELAEVIAGQTDRTVSWDTSKPNGDAKRLMDMARASAFGFECEVSLQEGIRDTINWYKANHNYSGRYNAFSESPA